MSEIRFGGYRVVETLGSGALSTIYKAVQEPLGRTVALKALKTQIAPTSSFGEQLEREAKLLADLVHPNIVLLLESARTASGRPYVVLEYVDGPSLADVLAKTKKLSVEAALAVACGICGALEHVHDRGVVHRDVKPSNVLLARSGVVKMIDFGIAQRPRTASLSDAFGTEGITPSGRMAPEQLKDAFGTPAYMSPEQILGDFVDGRSDLFSLGVVLYQMLSGSRPFEGKGGDAKASAQRIRRDPAPDLKSRAPHVPRAVERIVMRLLEKAPNDRYPSASAVRERLLTALRAETREEPSVIVKSLLAEAGFLAEPKQRGQERSSKAKPPLLRGMPKAMAGFAAIGVLFCLGVVAIEGTSWSKGDARKMELEADRSGGGLRVVATPWAYVRVDGHDVETTPFARPIPLSPGKHWVTLTHPDSAPVDREIEIAQGEIVTLDVTMPIDVSDAGKDAR